MNTTDREAREAAWEKKQEVVTSLRAKVEAVLRGSSFENAEWAIKDILKYIQAMQTIHGYGEIQKKKFFTQKRSRR